MFIAALMFMLGVLNAYATANIFNLRWVYGDVSSLWAFPGGSVVNHLPPNAGDIDLVPGSGRFLGEGNGNPLQHSCLENVIDRGAWLDTVHGIPRTRHMTWRLNHLHWLEIENSNS